MNYVFIIFVLLQAEVDVDNVTCSFDHCLLYVAYWLTSLLYKIYQFSFIFVTSRKYSFEIFLTCLIILSLLYSHGVIIYHSITIEPGRHFRVTIFIMYYLISYCQF